MAHDPFEDPGDEDVEDKDIEDKDDNDDKSETPNIWNIFTGYLGSQVINWWSK